MDNGRNGHGNKSPPSVTRSRAGNSMPNSPLWQNTHPGEEYKNATKTDIRPATITSSHDELQKALADDLTLLPPASLGYNNNNDPVKHHANGAQSPRVDGKTNGVRMVLNRRLSGIVHGTSSNTAPSTGRGAAGQARTTTNAMHPRGVGGESQSDCHVTPRDATPVVHASYPQQLGSPALAAKPSTEDINQESRSRGMFSGLSRKGSKLLRRARGPSKSDTELPDTRPSPTFSPILPIMPSSPPATLTLSPTMFPAYGPNGAMNSPNLNSLPKPASTTSLTMSESGSTPASPRVSGGKTPTSLMSPRTKKLDDLMKAFMTLDKDHERFHSRKVVLKANIVRDCVIPFLKTWSSHPMNTAVTAEDLHIRAMILSKWWATLVDMLKEIHNDKISGHDRPIVLEALVGVMERPEWRLASQDSISGLDSVPEDRRRTSSISSNSSPRFSTAEEKATIGESICALFEQNLAEQMTLVIEKMSQRTTPASLVSFCGKACAYAFFYCPGIADLLVRLWNLRSTTLKRILRAANLESPFRFPAEARTMMYHLPASLHSLCFTSLRDATTKLRQAAIAPDGIKDLDWRGYWLKRWSGKDSDLFYAFVKQYHVLLAEIVPRDTPKTEWLFAPGVLPVYAQILANLDMTIHRQSAGAASLPFKAKDGKLDPAAITFNDIDVSADAFAPASINATRIMSDNRLITLLKDLLPLKQQTCPPASYLFAAGFCDILKAAACHTSVYDHHACFTLCDFLEEAIAILGKFEANTSGPALIDWKFWMDVFTRMLRSENTLTQIRLYALLFTIWPLIAANARWKEHLCLDILLDPAQFHESFSHYCPLVRTYYHRLLCWRIARCDDRSDIDMQIIRIVQERLYLVHSTFRALQQQAQNDGRLLLETEPGTPAPNRRLLIIRTDVPPSPTTLMLEGFVPRMETFNTSMDLPPPALDANDGIDAVQLIEKLNLADNDPDQARKKGSIFRSLLGSRSPRIGSPKMDGRSQSPARTAREAALQVPTAMSPRSSLHQQRPLVNGRATGRISQEQAKADFKEAYFKFSLELVDKHKGPPKDIVYHKYPPKLPAQWQGLLEERNSDRRSVESNRSMRLVDAVNVERSSRYAGMALAEWHLVVNECQNFFERRRREGVPENRLVETPTLGVESLKRPG